MSKPILYGRNIRKTFTKGERQAAVLNGIDLDILAGDFTVIMGPSGAGKSTLLYALSGMEKITEGQIMYRGREISRLGERAMAGLRAREFGFVFQQTHLVSNLTLFENVAVAGFLNRDRTGGETRARAMELLERMGVGDARNRLPGRSSGGEAQRAALARAVINEPGLLFADEPTGALNRSSSREVLDLLTDLHGRGQSILLVTHDLAAAIRGSRILYLEDGKILDEFVLPPFPGEGEKERRERVSLWLSRFSW